ncbi:MAG TPA: N-acetyltransferase [Dehalococcoidia bacterium]|nr:N-acetyltransferase [Dehalococcoidia bacterium]
MLRIRHETASDHEVISRVVTLAFGRENVAHLVNALRDAGIARLSLVAEDDGQIVGHVMFTSMTIESETATHPAICLSPLGVVPTHQRRGVGARLLESGLAELRDAGHGAVFLLGHPSYYPRFGFRPAREFSVHYQDDRDAFMAIELYAGALEGVSGTAHFAEEFDAAG